MARQTKTEGQAGRENATESEYASIDLEGLIRFSYYADECRNSQVPLSIRAFMNGQGSHLTLLSNIDDIEARAQQLIILRAILDEGNRKTGRYTDSYQEAELSVPKPKTRREPGAITRYGRVWADLGSYLAEMIDTIVDGGGDPEYLRTFIKQQRDELRPLAQKVKHVNARKLEDRE